MKLSEKVMGVSHHFFRGLVSRGQRFPVKLSEKVMGEKSVYFSSRKGSVKAFRMGMICFLIEDTWPCCQDHRGCCHGR